MQKHMGTRKLVFISKLERAYHNDDGDVHRKLERERP